MLVELIHLYVSEQASKVKMYFELDHPTSENASRWRDMNVMPSQIPGHSTICLKDCADSNQSNIKVRISGCSWGEFTRDRWIPLTKGQ